MHEAATLRLKAYLEGEKCTSQLLSRRDEYDGICGFVLATYDSVAFYTLRYVACKVILCLQGLFVEENTRMSQYASANQNRVKMR